MSRIRLYIDEDATDEDVVDALLARRVDLLTVEQADMRARSDEEQLRFAAQQGRIIYTFNRKDYLVLNSSFLKRGESHAGIIIGEQRRFGIGEQMRRLLRIMVELSSEDMKDRVEFLSAWG